MISVALVMLFGTCVPLLTLILFELASLSHAKRKIVDWMISFCTPGERGAMVWLSLWISWC